MRTQRVSTSASIRLYIWLTKATDSHIYIQLPSDIDDDNDGSFHCCETRDLVDAKLDKLVGELKSVYPIKRSMNRLVGCHLGCTSSQRESNIDVDRILADLMEVWL